MLKFRSIINSLSCCRLYNSKRLHQSQTLKQKIQCFNKLNQKVYNFIQELSIHATNQQLKEFCTLFGKVKDTINEKGKGFIQLKNFEILMNNAKINFVLQTYSKYYTNLDVDTVLKTLGCKQGEIVDLGYTIKDKFVNFKQSKATPYQQSQQTLLKKMRNLVSIAEQMSAYE